MRYFAIHFPLAAGLFLTAFAAQAFAAPLPAPSLANDCGRAGKAMLKIIPGTRFYTPYPKYDLNLDMGHGVKGVMKVAEDGAMRVRLSVDGKGKLTDVTIVESSASQAFADAYVASVKAHLRLEAPPPECAGGAVLNYDAIVTSGEPPLIIYADDPRFPAGADKRKLASGAVRIRYRNDIEEAVVVMSAGSSSLDAAMIKAVSEMVRDRIKGQVMAASLEKIHFVTFIPEFITARFPTGDPAPERPTPVAATLPAPSLANDCGRTAKVLLGDVPGTHQPPFMPQKVVTVPLTRNTETRIVAHEEGAVRIRVLVDRNGNPAEVKVAESGAPEALEIQVARAIREHYRWQAPPAECAAKGVVVDIDYVATEASPDLQIYRDDPRFPAAARERKMGAAGIAVVRYAPPDHILFSRPVTSMGSNTLDDAMMKAAEGAAMQRLKTAPPGDATSTIFHVMFMPDFLASPRQAEADPRIRAVDRDIPQAPPPPPSDTSRQLVSAANDCGRSRIAYLPPDDLAKHRLMYPPQLADNPKSGDLWLRLLIDKDGVAREATVVSSSGIAAMDDSAVNSVRGSWRYQKPPPECAAQGAVIPLRVYYSAQSGGMPRIYLDDPDYPETLRATRTGTRARVTYTIEKGQITQVKTDGGFSQEVDAAAMMWAAHPPAYSNITRTVTTNLEFVPIPDPFNLDVLMGPPAPRPDH